MTFYRYVGHDGHVSFQFGSLLVDSSLGGLSDGEVNTVVM